MSIELTVYDNGDHTCLVWLPLDEQPIAGCRGFTIKRVCNGSAPNFLHGFVGFSDNDKLDPNNPWKFPVQRYLWWDYSVKEGDTVEYSIIPVVGKDKDHLVLADNLASDVSPAMKITGQCTPHLSAYFNKGIVASQWVSRALAAQSTKEPIKQIVATPGNDLRNELSGLLRPKILNLMNDWKTSGGLVFAALYELNDLELIPGLRAFGKNCNLILANGAFKPPDNDENQQVRADLKNTVRVYDRIVSSPHFAHNKFVVFCDADRSAKKVLTGSTNWTSSGLCTQANNGVIVDDPGVAQDYLDAWDRIHTSGNGYPPTLASANSTSKTYEVDGCKVTPWFAPTQHAEDLDYARKIIASAKEGILFLFFNPGAFEPDSEPEKWTLLQNILNRHHEENNAYYNPNLYIKGVVNQQIPYLTEENAPAQGKKPPSAAMDPTTPAHSVALYSNGIEPPQRLGSDVLVPANIKDKYGPWEKELLGASMVNIHSKVIVVDPFGENPVLMTGSHNLGFKASSENDDNLIILEGNGPLAAAYAINVISIFQSYRWNHSVALHRQDPKFWHGLEDDDTWQKDYLAGDHLAEIKFWLGKEEAGSAASPAAVAGSTLPAERDAHGSSSIHAVHATQAAVSPRPSVRKRPAHVAHKATVHSSAGVQKEKDTRSGSAGHQRQKHTSTAHHKTGTER